MVHGQDAECTLVEGQEAEWTQCQRDKMLKIHTEIKIY